MYLICTHNKHISHNEKKIKILLFRIRKGHIENQLQYFLNKCEKIRNAPNRFFFNTENKNFLYFEIHFFLIFSKIK